MTEQRTGLRVLVLEDRPDDAELMIAMLDEAGYRVSWNRVDDEGAFRSALRDAPDLVLADYAMPAFDVERALAVRAESRSDVPVIVVSGTISEGAGAACLRAGAADYLLKDRLNRLPAAVAAVLESRRLRDEHADALAQLAQTARELTTVNHALRSADEAKDHLLAVAAHELRTPLTAVRGYARLLTEEWHGEARVRGLEWVAAMEEHARRMTGLVEHLLLLAELKLGSTSLQLDWIPVRVPLARAVDSCSAPVTLDCPESLFADVDADRLELTVRQLLDNAVAHGGPSIGVAVRLDPNGEWFEISVSDDGPGVPAAFQSALFEQFTQATPRIQGAAGAGLGLAVAAGLATAQGGTLRYDDRGLGACFVLRLRVRGALPPAPAEPEAAPVSADRVSRQRVDQLAGAPGGGGRIVVADDEPTIRALIAFALTRHGFEVIQAADGREALAACREPGVDLAILDVEMPHLTGFDVVEALRSDHRTEDLPVLLCTAHRLTVDDPRHALVGPQCILGKPFELDELRRRAEHVMRSRQRN